MLCKTLVCYPDGRQEIVEEEIDEDILQKEEDVWTDADVSLEKLSAENKLLKQQVSALTEQQSFYEDCIVELASVVYA